jgi:hypothetical protein
MKENCEWHYNDFFITKEEIIVLRTLYLEYGDEGIKKTRLELPYENIDIDEFCEGYHAIDLFDKLLFYQLGGKYPRPLDLEFLRYTQFSPDYGIPWQLTRFNFVNDIKLDRQKIRLNNRFKGTLILLNELADSLGEPHEPEVIECLERPDDMIYLESLEDYKKLSNNMLFNNLRIGLWYKKFGYYENALKFLEEARKNCKAALILFNLRNGGYIKEFNDKMEPYKEIGIDIMSDPDEYHNWWVSKSKLIKVPIELQLSAEENPSFQIGEIYLKQGEKYLKEKEYGKAKNNYIKANRYFQEVENYLFLWYRKNRHLKYNEQIIEDEFDVKKPVEGKGKGWDALTKKQKDILLEVTLKTPLYLPLNIKPFQRNPYLERNLQICKSRLELIKSKKISKKDSVKDQKAKALENIKDKELIKNNYKMFFEYFVNKTYKEGTPLKANIKKINKNSIEDDCKKKFSIIYPKLCWESKNELIKDRINEKITISEKIFDFRPSIGCLSRMLEKEAEVTMIELIKKYKLNFHFKSNEYKIGKLKKLLKEFGQERLKIDKKELDAIINELNRASDFRAPFAHPTRGGTHDELSEFRKLLFGSDKEEDGLLYKITKYRSI